MANTGDRFEMLDGSVYEVPTSASDTNGELVEMEFTLPPGSVAPPPHVHPAPVEEYELLEGTLDVMVDGRWRSLMTGQSATCQPGSCTRSRTVRSCPGPERPSPCRTLRGLHRAHLQADPRSPAERREGPAGTDLPLHGDARVPGHARTRPRQGTGRYGRARGRGPSPAVQHRRLTGGARTAAGVLTGGGTSTRRSGHGP
jgi:Cupin domain